MDNNTFLSDVFFGFVFHIVHLETNVSLPYKKKKENEIREKQKEKKCRDQDLNLGYCGHNAVS